MQLPDYGGITVTVTETHCAANRFRPMNLASSNRTAPPVQRRIERDGDGNGSRSNIDAGAEDCFAMLAMTSVASPSGFAQGGGMLGMDFIRANRDAVEQAIRDKGVALDLDALLALDAEVRSAKGEIEALRAPLGRAFAS